MFAIENFLEAAHGVGHWYLLALAPGKHLGHAEGLTEKTLNLARPQNCQLVVGRQFIHAEERDDVLKILVALEHRLDATRNFVVLFTNDLRRKRARSRSKRIDRRVDTELSNRTLEDDRSVKMREGRRGRGI